jgi:transposase
MFVDFTAGLDLVDAQTGEVTTTQLFIGVWGHSNFTYAEAVPNQAVPAWTNCHVHAFAYSGVAPHVLVPDNLKSGVTRPCLYEPEVNRSYGELAAYYGAAILPARPYHARDKAKAEAGVLLAQRWILAVLRHRTFFSLGEMNVAIRELLEKLNKRAMRKIKRSRKEIFESADRPAALPLPERPYEYAAWSKHLVHIDYCIEVDYHIYSVPFRLMHETLDVRLTATTLEAFYEGRRVAAHARSYVKGGQTILEEHRPPEHQKHGEWPPSRMIAWAAKAGPSAAVLVERILASRRRPEEGYRACLGIMRLGRDYGPERLEAAAARALKFNALSFRSVKSILVAGLDRAADAGDEGRQPGLPLHENIRGGAYYH